MNGSYSKDLVNPYIQEKVQTNKFGKFFFLLMLFGVLLLYLGAVYLGDVDQNDSLQVIYKKYLTAYNYSSLR